MVTQRSWHSWRRVSQWAVEGGQASQWEGLGLLAAALAGCSGAAGVGRMANLVTAGAGVVLLVGAAAPHVASALADPAGADLSGAQLHGGGGVSVGTVLVREFIEALCELHCLKEGGRVMTLDLAGQVGLEAFKVTPAGFSGVHVRDFIHELGEGVVVGLDRASLPQLGQLTTGQHIAGHWSKPGDEGLLEIFEGSPRQDAPVGVLLADKPGRSSASKVGC